MCPIAPNGSSYFRWFYRNDHSLMGDKLGIRNYTIYPITYTRDTYLLSLHIRTSQPPSLPGGGERWQIWLTSKCPLVIKLSGCLTLVCHYDSATSILVLRIYFLTYLFRYSSLAMTGTSVFRRCGELHNVCHKSRFFGIAML